MKRFMKISLGLVILLLVLGTGCLIGAFSVGAEAPEFVSRIQQIIKGETTIERYKFDGNQVQQLDIEAGSGTLRIVQGEGDEIILKNKGRWMNASLSDDGELKIQKKHFGFRFFGIGTKGGEATLILPKNIRFEELSLDCGSGNISAQKLLAEEISIDCGSGDVSADFADTKSLEINIGSGDIDLNLTGKLKDYDYEIDCGSGDVNLGESHFSSTEYKLKEQREKSIEIDSGSGDITIDFLGNERNEETL